MPVTNHEGKISAFLISAQPCHDLKASMDTAVVHTHTHTFMILSEIEAKSAIHWASLLLRRG